jgi:hypothetical protein
MIYQTSFLLALEMWRGLLWTGRSIFHTYGLTVVAWYKMHDTECCWLCHHQHLTNWKEGIICRPTLKLYVRTNMVSTVCTTWKWLKVYGYALFWGSPISICMVIGNYCFVHLLLEPKYVFSKGDTLCCLDWSHFSFSGWRCRIILKGLLFFLELHPAHVSYIETATNWYIWFVVCHFY